MTDSTRGLFRESASKKMNSPDRLDEYIKVTNPGVWIVLVSAIILLGALFYWGVVGTIPTNVSANGIVNGDRVVCFLPPDKIAEVNAGDGASVLNKPGIVTSVSETPLSTKEASQGIGSDYTVYELKLSDWNYLVVIEVDGLSATEGALVPVVITAEEVAPISFLVN